MKLPTLHLKIVRLFDVLLDVDIKSVVVQTNAGSYGFLPRRLDCIAALAPGIIGYEELDGSEKFAAADEGVLVKTGAMIHVCVRNAVLGTELGQLQNILKQEFAKTARGEIKIRELLGKLEVNFARQWTQMLHAE